MSDWLAKQIALAVKRSAKIPPMRLAVIRAKYEPGPRIETPPDRVIDLWLGR